MIEAIVVFFVCLFFFFYKLSELMFRAKMISIAMSSSQEGTKTQNSVPHL